MKSSCTLINEQLKAINGITSVIKKSKVVRCDIDDVSISKYFQAFSNGVKLSYSIKIKAHYLIDFGTPTYIEINGVEYIVDKQTKIPGHVYVLDLIERTDV